MTAIDLRAVGIPIDDIRSRDLSWNIICAELVDNGFDAKARRIELVLAKRAITVRDDGIGVKDTQALLIYGRHDPHTSTQSGRYGVGAKLALYRGDQIDITTVRDGFKHAVSLHVPPLRKDASHVEWPAPTPTDDPSGTTICISKIPADFAEIRLRDIRAFLSRTYAPGIQDGRQILIGTDAAHLQPIPAWEPPVQTDLIEIEHDFGDGRRLRCRAGLLHDPKADGRGTFAAYGFRHLDDTQLGLEESPGARIHVALTLSEDRYRSWHLDTNKRKLLEVHAGEVSAFLRDFLRPLIEKERQQRLNLKVDGANRLLEIAFGSSRAGSATPQKGPGTKTGGRWGQGGGARPSPPSPAKPDEPATRARTRRPAAPQGLTVVPDQLPDGEAFRYSESTMTAEVRFNTDHALWRQIGDDLDAIARTALFIYEYEQVLRSLQRQQRLPFSNPVGESFGRKLEGIAFLAPKRAGAA